MNTTYDTIIIGGGIAGIVCAIELLDRQPHKTIAIIDRDTRDAFGGLARESFGGILIVGTPEQARAGIHDSPELALADWLAFGNFGKDPQAEFWPKKWAEHYVKDSKTWIYDWLRSHKLRFIPMPLWVERGLFGEGNSVPRWHVVWGTGEYLIERLVDVLFSHKAIKNVDFFFNHKVESLLTEDNNVIGCSGILETDIQKDRSFSLHANHVIVATGGINGSLDRVRKHWHTDWGTPPKVILNGAHKFADGTLHDATQSLGGSITYLDRQWNYAAGVHHWNPNKPLHGLSLVPSKSAVWVNALGKRIGPMPLVSGFDTRDLVTQICKQPGGYSYHILNEKIAFKEFAISGSESNHAIRNRKILQFASSILFGNKNLIKEVAQHCIDIVVAKTLPELVDKMNALPGNTETVDLKTLEHDITSYDNEIGRGKKFYNDEQLRRINHLCNWRGDRLRTCQHQKILDPEAGPLIAIRLFIVSRKSLGGIETNLDGAVLHATTRKPIPNLYAIGEAAGFGGGGMNGLRGLEGTFLGGCIYSARRTAIAISSQ